MSKFIDSSLGDMSGEGEFGLVIDAVGSGATRRFGSRAIFLEAYLYISA